MNWHRWYIPITTMVPSAMPLSENVSLNFRAVSPIPMMRPAAIGMRLSGLPKSTPFSFHILAPRRPIMP